MLSDFLIEVTAEEKQAAFEKCQQYLAGDWLHVKVDDMVFKRIR